MAYDPTIPDLDHYVGDDIPKIMANFAELAGSRIVDHNLDVAKPPNGHYVRYAYGRQECWVAVTVSVNAGASADGIWTYPAVFAAVPTIVTGLRTSGGTPALALDQDIGLLQESESQVTWVVRNNTSLDRTLMVYLRAVGRWQ